MVFPEMARLARQASAPRPAPIAVHPNLAEIYRRRVAEFETLLVDPELRDEAMELIRSMIEAIELSPDEDGWMALLLRGDLALCAAAGAGAAASGVRRKRQNPASWRDGVYDVGGCGGSTPPLPNMAVAGSV
ncbi:MAG: hypothetical protein EA385_10485, partial [Salinarimonadaceae bacterium]